VPITIPTKKQVQDPVQKLKTLVDAGLASRDEAICAARNDGATLRELASVFGLSVARVQQILSGIAGKEFLGKEPPEKLQQMRDLYEAGMSLHELADHFGMAYRRVSDLLKGADRDAHEANRTKLIKDALL
jgi:AraC-like DNA-binding protein